MLDRILIVDDDRNLLDSLRRQLRKHFDIVTALGPQEGLNALNEQGPFAVVVSDLRMPVMDGVVFLSHASRIAPDSVRIMLTGNADLANAVKAVNEGRIYRFLTKPCETAILVQVLEQGAEQFRLVQAEKELLEKTLRGSIQMLTDLLSTLNPEVFGRASVIKNYAHAVAEELQAEELWKIDTAALLSQIGYVTLPEALAKKVSQGAELTEAESRLYEAHPKVAADLLSHIPRIEAVVESVLYQLKRFNGGGVPNDRRRGADIPLGARILKVASDFDQLLSQGLSKSDAVGILRSRRGHYDPAVLDALEKVLGVHGEALIREVAVADLTEGMVFSEDVRAVNGRMLLPRGHTARPIIIQRLQTIPDNMGIAEPLRVHLPNPPLESGS